MVYEYALEPELVATWGNRQDFRYFVEKFGLGQPRIVSRYPKPWKRLVRLLERPQRERLHNRYILTDLGGVLFGVGLDEGDGGDTDDLHLLDRAQYDERWQQYASDAPAFDQPEPPIEIRGA